MTRDREQVIAALKKYLDMNKLALGVGQARRAVPPRSPCTGLVSEEQFLDMLRRAVTSPAAPSKSSRWPAPARPSFMPTCRNRATSRRCSAGRSAVRAQAPQAWGHCRKTTHTVLGSSEFERAARCRKTMIEACYPLSVKVERDGGILTPQHDGRQHVPGLTPGRNPNRIRIFPTGRVPVVRNRNDTERRRGYRRVLEADGACRSGGTGSWRRGRSAEFSRLGPGRNGRHA